MEIPQHNICQASTKLAYCQWTSLSVTHGTMMLPTCQQIACDMSWHWRWWQDMSLKFGASQHDTTPAFPTQGEVTAIYKIGRHSIVWKCHDQAWQGQPEHWSSFSHSNCCDMGGQSYQEPIHQEQWACLQSFQNAVMMTCQLWTAYRLTSPWTSPGL